MRQIWPVWLSLFCLCFQVNGQQTFVVKKESLLFKAIFDNTEYKLIAIDRYGNLSDSKIISYKFYVKEKNGVRQFEGYGNELNADILKYLKKLKNAAKIFFTEIMAEDENHHLVKLPDIIDTWFPDCKSGGK